MNQEKIGKFIATKRKEKKLTQLEVAEKLGVTDRTISNWENGKNMPDLSLFKPLCEILNISINELMSGEEINDSEYKDKLEENIINTIDYIDKKNIKNNDKKNIIWLIIGILGVILSQLFITNIETQNYLTIISMIISIYSIKQLFYKHSTIRKIIAIILLIICIISIIIK